MQNKFGSDTNLISSRLQLPSYDLKSLFFRLLPRDTEIEKFIGRPQLTEFLCWLDYANCVAKECADTAIAIKLAEQLRFHLFESSIEPAIIEPNFTAFALVLAAKVINKIDAKFICDREYIFICK